MVGRYCDITILLDRTGSMQNIKDEITKGFSKWVEQQQKLNIDKCTLTLIQFDNHNPFEVIYENKPINDIPYLTLEPRGMTPLLDALGNTIQWTGSRLGAMAQEERPDKVLIIILTDGEENASSTYTKATIRKMITHQQDKYNWQFLFLGMGFDAFAEARQLGIPAGAVSSSTADTQGVQASYNIASKAVKEYVTNGTITLNNK